MPVRRRLPSSPSFCTSTRRTVRSAMPATQAGPALKRTRVSRGLAVGDLFNDGNMDVVVGDIDGPPDGPAQPWCSRTPLGQLRTGRHQEQSPGARTPGSKSSPAGMTQTDEMHQWRQLSLAKRSARPLRPGSGHQDRHPSRFAGPPARWTRSKSLAADHFYSVLEGKGIVAAEEIRPKKAALK